MLYKLLSDNYIYIVTCIIYYIGLLDGEVYTTDLFGYITHNTIKETMGIYSSSTGRVVVTSDTDGNIYTSTTFGKEISSSRLVIIDVMFY